MSREQIVRDTAYAIWEAEGKPHGRDAEHWRQAEERVAGSLSQAGDVRSASKGKATAAKAASGEPKPAKRTTAAKSV